MLVRDARDADSAAVIALIAEVFSEYPGCILDVDREEPHLRRVATAFREWGGGFWVAEDGGRVVACCGYRPARQGAGLELKHLYVGPAARRRGLGNRFSEMVEREAQRRGAGFVELWSDTRFEDAHRLYESRGYARGRQTRDLNDLSHSVEHHFRKDLPGSAA